MTTTTNADADTDTPTATPHLPDRSAWPVLVRLGSNKYSWNGGVTAVAEYRLGRWSAWLPGLDGKRLGDAGAFGSAREAADAIRARLPDEVSEAAQTVAPQPAPTNATGDVWQELIDAEPPGRIRDLMVARRAQGIAKYGRPLERENGRDHVADAIQEALDGMVYAVAAGRAQSMYAFRNALNFLTGEVAESAWVWRAASDAEIAALTARAESAEAELAEVREHLSRWSAPERTAADMAAAARSYVAEVEQEGGHYARLCQAAHDALDAAQAPGGSSPDVRIAWLSDARSRAESLLSARTKDRDSLEAAWDAARTDAARLRAAIADALDITGQVPPDDELVRRLRELDGSHDLAVVRKVIGTCTTTIRKVVCEEKDAVSIAVDGLCEVIETTVGVERG